MDINSIIRWFDPNATYHDAVKRAGATAQAARGQRKPPPVFVQYLFFSLGVLISPFIRQYRSSGTWPAITSKALVGSVLFALITGFMLFPRVIDTLAGPEANTLSRLSTIFTAGLGWEQMSGLPSALASH